MSNVTLLVDPLNTRDPAEARQWLQARRRQLGGGPVYWIRESLEKVEFRDAATAGEPPLDGSTAGRIFSPAAELRWRFDAGHWRLRFLRESNSASSAPAGAELIPARRQEQNYYLLGFYENGRCREGERLAKAFDYPVAWTQELDRARLRVAEYLAAPTAADPAALTAALNQPRLLAHRFLAVETGQD